MLISYNVQQIEEDLRKNQDFMTWVRLNEESGRYCLNVENVILYLFRLTGNKYQVYISPYYDGEQPSDFIAISNFCQRLQSVCDSLCKE